MNLVNFWLKLKERETQKRTAEAEEAPDLFESLPSLPKARQKALLEEERVRLAGRLDAVDAYLAEIAD